MQEGREPDARSGPEVPAGGSLTGKLAFALGLGLAGGFMADGIGVPLAWMIGPMVFVAVAAISGVPVCVPNQLRTVMVAILGIMLGSAFTPEIVSGATQWLPSMGALVLYSAIVTAILCVYLRRVGGFDPVTAYFASVPGGLNQMILTGGSLGGDSATVSLIHALRIFLVVGTVPLWFTLTAGYERPEGLVPGATNEIALIELGILAAVAVGGAAGAWLLKVPAGPLVGPMVLSGVLHATGVVEGRPPALLVVVALLVVGASIGARFAGIRPSLVFRALLLGLGATVVMLVTSGLFAFVLSAATGIGATTIFLAFVPGGLAEMSLVALALNLDPAFVSAHHVVRIALLVFLAPAAFPLFVPRRLRGDSGN